MIKISELDKIIEDVRYRKIRTMEARVKILTWIENLEPDEAIDLVKKLTIPVVGCSFCSDCGDKVPKGDNMCGTCYKSM